MKSPCTRDCPNRSVSPNCHMTCQQYLAYVEHRESVREKRGAENKIHYLIRYHPKDTTRKPKVR